MAKPVMRDTIVNRGVVWHVTKHAAERYLERAPTGPGIKFEIPNFKRPGKKKLAAIRASAPLHRQIPPAKQAYFVTHSGVFACAVKGRGEYSIVTFWKPDRAASR